MRISREEIFGPVSAVLKYSDVDDAIAPANNTEFGYFASNHAAPFGGRHDSGLGTEHGIEGLSAYLSYKSIHRRG